jgi:hypothetical protein
MDAIRISYTDDDHLLAPAIERLAKSNGLSVISVEHYREYQDHQVDMIVEDHDSAAPESYIRFLKDLPNAGVTDRWVEVFTPNETLLRTKQEFEAAGISEATYETRY